MNTTTERYNGMENLEREECPGIEVEARTLEQLFDRAATYLLSISDSCGKTERKPDRARDVELRVMVCAPNLPVLMVRWLRELRYLHESRGFRYKNVVFDSLRENGLNARVSGAYTGRSDAKGAGDMTCHALEVGQSDDVWRARIAFNA